MVDIDPVDEDEMFEPFDGEWDCDGPEYPSPWYVELAGYSMFATFLLGVWKLVDIAIWVCHRLPIHHSS